MEEPGLVFHVIAEAGNTVNMVNSFMEHLVHIFAHVKAEITEFCESLELPTLLAIRSELFNKLPIRSLGDRELLDRHKISLVAEDVYLLGFSLLNKKLHKNINKILKRSKVKPDQTTRNIDQTGDNTELITVSKSEDQNEHSVELITVCISLKKTVKELQSQLMEVTKRVTLLEGELDTLKSVSPEVANETTKYPKNMEISRLIEVKADVHHDQYGNKQTVNNDRLTQKNDNVESINGDDFSGAENPFRHTDKERKNILRKPRPKPVEKLKPVAIKPSKQSSVRTYLVYIGKLDRDTSEDSVRCHLAEIGIDSDDIADIIKLK